MSIFDCSYPAIARICPAKCQTGGGPCPPTVAPTAPTMSPTTSPTQCQPNVDDDVCNTLFTRSNNPNNGINATAATDQCCLSQELAKFCATTCCGWLDSCAPTAAPTISPTMNPTTAAPTSLPTTSFPTAFPTENCDTSYSDTSGFECDGSDLIGITIEEACILSSDPDRFSYAIGLIAPYHTICSRTCCLVYTGKLTNAPTVTPTASPSCGANLFDECPAIDDTSQCCHPIWGESVRRNCPSTCCQLTCSPTISPTVSPSASPTLSPSFAPTSLPTAIPTLSPSSSPTLGCQNDSVPVPLTGLLEPCAASCCHDDHYIRLLAGQFCSTTCCNVTCAPTASPTTSAPTTGPTVQPSISPTPGPTTSPSFTADVVGATCLVSECCSTNPLVAALYRLECATTCGPLWPCDATMPPTAAPTHTDYVVASGVPLDPTHLRVLSADYDDAVSRYNFDTGMAVKLMSDSGAWIDVGIFTGLHHVVGQDDVRVMVFDRSVAASFGSVPAPGTVWLPYPYTVAPTTAAPTAAPTTIESFCRQTGCGADCHGSCGWSKNVGRCIPSEDGEETTSGDFKRGWTCDRARTANDRCNVFTCGVQCSQAAGCGWSTSKSRCVEGGKTQPSEMGMGVCDFADRTVEARLEGTFGFLASYNTTAVDYPSAATGTATLEVYNDDTSTVTIAANAFGESRDGYEYMAHLHSRPCSENAGGHYQNPGCGQNCGINAVDEIWPNFVVAGGSGNNAARATWVPARSDFEYLSVVIHDTPNTGNKMLCADLVQTFPAPRVTTQPVTTTTTTAEPGTGTAAPLVVKPRKCSEITCVRDCYGDCGWSSSKNKCKEGARTSSSEFIAGYGC